MASADDLARSRVCRLVARRDALRHFAVYDGPTQSQQHIKPLQAIVRFHAALREMSGRHGIRDDISRYEAVSMGLVKVRAGLAGRLLAGFPTEESPLHIERFFSTLYQRYEERFVYGAPNLKSVTSRLEWAPDSPALAEVGSRLDYDVRVAT